MPQTTTLQVKPRLVGSDVGTEIIALSTVENIKKG